MASLRKKHRRWGLITQQNHIMSFGQIFNSQTDADKRQNGKKSLELLEFSHLNDDSLLLLLLQLFNRPSAVRSWLFVRLDVAGFPN